MHAVCLIFFYALQSFTEKRKDIRTLDKFQLLLYNLPFVYSFVESNYLSREEEQQIQSE
jgi:hypothetical protein